MNLLCNLHIQLHSFHCRSQIHTMQHGKQTEIPSRVCLVSSEINKTTNTFTSFLCYPLLSPPAMKLPCNLHIQLHIFLLSGLTKRSIVFSLLVFLGFWPLLFSCTFSVASTFVLCTTACSFVSSGLMKRSFLSDFSRSSHFIPPVSVFFLRKLVFCLSQWNNIDWFSLQTVQMVSLDLMERSKKTLLISLLPFFKISQIPFSFVFFVLKNKNKCVNTDQNQLHTDLFAFFSIKLFHQRQSNCSFFPLCPCFIGLDEKQTLSCSWCTSFFTTSVSDRPFVDIESWLVCTFCIPDFP